MNTFIVRIAPADDPADEFHGVVRRIADGDERPFHGADQLIDLMRPPDDQGTRAAER